jgi:hypothetical protein
MYGLEVPPKMTSIRLFLFILKIIFKRLCIEETIRLFKRLNKIKSIKKN